MTQQAKATLSGWFAAPQQRGSGMAYAFFTPWSKTKPWTKVVWKSYLMPKYQFYIMAPYEWGQIRTKDKLSYESCKTCPLCQRAYETLDHTFFVSVISKALWDQVRA